MKKTLFIVTVTTATVIVLKIGGWYFVKRIKKACGTYD